MPITPHNSSDTQILQRLERQLAREKRARQHAEKLLEDKSKELYEKHQSLERELSAKLAVQNQLAAEKKQAQITLESIGDAVISLDSDNGISFANPVAEQLLNASLERMLGAPFSQFCQLVDAVTNKDITDTLFSLPEDACEHSSPGDDIECRTGSAQSVKVEWSIAPLRVEDGVFLGRLLVLRDVTENRSLVSQLEHIARHDYLTKLPNRFSFAEQLARQTSLARRHQGHFAIMFVDIDRFKTINDTLGHALGDKVIVAAAQRISSILRKEDMVCRQGGDEFVILTGQLKSERDASQIARKIIDVFKAPLRLESHVLTISVSIGISLYPEDNSDPEALLNHADSALYAAKDRGRNGFQFFTKSMRDKLQRRLELENAISNALENKEFFLAYQPKVHLKSQTVKGAEALLRWNSRTLGFVSPDEFIPIAEETGCIHELGMWVIETACEEIKYWEEQNIPLKIAVNVSVVQLQKRDFVARLGALLARHQVSPCQLEIELTESVVMNDTDHMLSTMHAIRALGVSLAIDDFGTGYSSLSYLRALPVDVLKIDRSFVSELSNDKQSYDIVHAIVALGDSLRLEVVAEGVENQSELEALTTLNCHLYQGYYFSKPLNSEQFRTFMSDHLPTTIER